MKKDFLSIADFTPEELQHLLDLAISLKRERQAGRNQPILVGKVLGMIFQKPSLRTRISFDMAMRHLGGDALYLSPSEIGLGQRESVADVARVLSGYVDAIMARVFSHDHILQLAKWSSVPVINGLSDFDHPCQGMADALTIVEHFGGLKGLNIAYVGDGNNVAVSLLHICSKLGANFRIATPAGFGLKETVLSQAESYNQTSGGQVKVLTDPFQAVTDSHVIYTDTWTSMGQEAEAKQRELVFPPFQVNARLISAARKDVIVMHCLPAHRGSEVTDEVMDAPYSIVFDQAENRLHVQKAVMATLMK